MTAAPPRQAFVHRVRPSGLDRFDEVRATSRLVTGWSGAPELLDDTLSWEQFRATMYRVHYPQALDLRAAGRAAGEMWRFIREMRPHDWIVIPHGPDFYVVEIVGDVEYREEYEGTDTAFRRPIHWLNEGRPIARHQAPAALQARMKIQGTSARATDLLEQIEEVLTYQAQGQEITIDDELRDASVQTILGKLRTGRVNERGFERIVAAVLRANGAHEVRILDRRTEDKGADIVATFLIGGASQITLAVQAKYYRPSPSVSADPLDQLVEGIRAEQADLGWVVTTGSFSEEAEMRRDTLQSEGFRIELVDGEQFARMIVETGLRSFVASRQ